MITLQLEKMKKVKKDTWVLDGVACGIIQYQKNEYGYVITFSIDDSTQSSGQTYRLYQDAVNAMNEVLKQYNRYVEITKRETVSVNWNNEKSIQNAERKKARLENLGYSLINTQSNLDSAILTYELL